MMEEEQLLNVKKLMERWGFKEDIDLINCIRAGLPAYHPVSLERVKVQGIYFYIEKEMEREVFPKRYGPRRSLRDEYEESRNRVPVYETYIKKIEILFDKLIFKLPEIDDYEKQNQIERQDMKVRASTKDRMEVLKQANSIWGDIDKDNLPTRATMAAKLCKFSPGSYYTEQQIIKWLKDDKLGRNPGNPQKGKRQ